MFHFLFYISSDVPLLSPQEVNYFPSAEDTDRIRSWMKFRIGQMIADYHPAFSDCGKFVE